MMATSTQTSFRPFWFVLLVAIMIVGATCGIFYLASSSATAAKKQAEMEKNLANCQNENGDWQTTPVGFYRNKDGKCMKIPPPPPSATQQRATLQTKDALVLEKECLTPCSSYYGWRYKIRTDGHPLRVKFDGLDWIDYPAEGSVPTPDGFKPGEAYFESPDKEPRVMVQVYKIVTIQQ
jgi:type II secretory pathway pseudopilin PulG